MDVHKRITGVLMAVLGGLGLLSLLMGLLVSLGFGAMSLSFWQMPTLEVGIGFLVMGFLALLYALWCVAALIAGVAAVRDDPRAGRVLVPVAVVALIGFPIGTAAGIYTLWAWWRPAAAPR